jgi:U3 small nucleolar RNA-associated protein 21
MELHRPSSLLAVGLSDFSLQVIDVVARNVVRIFEGHDDQLTDMTFSPDARWIVSSALDATLKVWDVPSGAFFSNRFVKIEIGIVQIILENNVI